jgi:hypothetical protein
LLAQIIAQNQQQAQSGVMSLQQALAARAPQAPLIDQDEEEALMLLLAA